MVYQRFLESTLLYCLLVIDKQESVNKKKVGTIKIEA